MTINMKDGDMYIGSLLLLEKIRVADTFATRFRGLMGCRSFDGFSGLLIVPCRQIHTCFMRLTIDALYLDKDMQVVRIMPQLEPGKLLPAVWQAHQVLELPAGTAARYGIREGDRFSLVVRR